MKALIALEDGTIFEGRAFAGRGEIEGELVFNTSMTGYQEILTDPSYHGQIVTMTYPLIGNYGVNPADVESGRPQAAGLVISEHSRIPSNWRSTRTLADYLVENDLLGIDGVDTRAITLHIRAQGAMKCIISTEEADPQALVHRARQSPGLAGRDLAREVTCPARYTWPGPHAAQADRPLVSGEGARAYDDTPCVPGGPHRVAVLDCGAKFNMLRLLAQRGCTLEVFPITTPAAEILACQPDGFFITNGPGDPEGVPYAVETIRTVIATGLPTFGICFGHQLLGLALGGKTYKLKFGHRGANQPVMDLRTRKVDITSQNHGFCVDKDSLDPDLVESTHINLNDNTSEGLRHRTHPIFSVQHHPEANPGPHDAVYLFDQFAALMAGREAPK
ncbi:MAG: glutamine-hydrolyzing carbamoyl-phosphate synthase small subunit [Candidatus Marinimicrobia bacterium]|nr:glutamine-hydrolyzing carbamoyl-phosphate synthase small subunit [Candidatus Neomarinimicrobiota bacterium]